MSTESYFHVLRMIDEATDSTPRRVHNNAFPHRLSEERKTRIVEMGALEHDQAHLYSVNPNGQELWEASCRHGEQPVP